MMVCHTCDVRSCVNPDHLFLGFAKDNVNDRHVKGRTKVPKGVKLTKEQVIEIRGRKDVSHYQLAREYGVSRPNISTILSNNSWKGC